MYTKTKCRRKLGRVLAPGIGSVAGSVLYVVTLVGETMVSGGARFCLGFAVTFSAGVAFDCPLAPRSGGAIAALGPIVWSVAALVWPGTSWFCRHRIGARRPGGHESEKLALALEALGAEGSLLRRIWVLDDPIPGGWVLGVGMVVTRALLDDERCLRAVIAHELFHLRGADGRLSSALVRLGLWTDPVGPHAEVAGHGDGVMVAVLWSGIRILVAGGGCRPVYRLLSPAWSLHWRSREYRADAYAVELGVGEELLAYLEEMPQAMDRPQPGVLRGRFVHPPVALRVSRVRRALGRE